MVITRRELPTRRATISQYHQPSTSNQIFVCVDWGASYWRQYDSILGGASNAEPSLVIYNKEKGELLSGERALTAWLTKNTYIRFDNLKALFDTDSNHYEEECERIQSLQIPISIEDVLEHWWLDRFGALLKRIGPRDKITIAIAHPAHFSPTSVQKFQDYFARSRDGRQFEVVVSEESTAALHGSRYSGFGPGIVLVLDGGKSTIVITPNL